MTIKAGFVILSCVMTRGAEFFETARKLGVELEKKPAERIAITGMAALTPLGDTEQTSKGLENGSSGVKSYDVKNFEVGIAAPVIFDPLKYFTKKEMREKSPLNAMAIVLAREAMGKAGLLGENGKLRKDIDRRSVASWIGSAFGSSMQVIDVYKKIHKISFVKVVEGKDEDGNDYALRAPIEDMVEGSRFVPPRAGLQTFPEELNGQVAIDLGISGPGGSVVAACATGINNPNEALGKIKSGEAKIAVAGALEDLLVPHSHPEVCIGLFAAMGPGVLSRRNSDPEKASRPFDRDRDGFIAGSGGGVIIFEEYEHALMRGAPILAEVLGFANSMDGSDPTNLNIEIVAGTIIQALYNEKKKEFYDVDAIFAHATSTKLGDIAETEVYREVFGDDLKNIPITAIKSIMGHLLGGAGAVNIIAAVNALIRGKIPHILNLDNPDPKFADLNLVKGKPLERDINTALVVGYGFGGHNGVMLLKKYNKAT